MHMCAHLCVWMHMWRHVCGEQRFVLGVFLGYSRLDFLRQGLSLKLELTCWFGFWLASMLWDPCLCLLSTRIGHRTSQQPSFYVWWNMNPVPQASSKQFIQGPPPPHPYQIHMVYKSCLQSERKRVWVKFIPDIHKFFP